MGPFWIQTWTDHVSPLKCEYIEFTVCLLKVSLGNALCVTGHFNGSCVYLDGSNTVQGDVRSEVKLSKQVNIQDYFC